MRGMGAWPSPQHLDGGQGTPRAPTSPDFSPYDAFSTCCGRADPLAVVPVAPHSPAQQDPPPTATAHWGLPGMGQGGGGAQAGSLRAAWDQEPGGELHQGGLSPGRPLSLWCSVSLS